jgi:beta-glucanase (GH16 family)
MISKVLLALLVGATSQTLAAETNFAQPAVPPLPGYRLVWSDEFAGSKLDTNKWSYRTGERLLSFQKPENVSVSDGLLRIALKKEKAGKLDYTAGGVISRQTFLYGYYEARFRCPKGAGWHTSFWTMCTNKSAAQEIDICEQDSANNRSYKAGVIDWSRSGKKIVSFGHTYFFSPEVELPDFSADFHVWGCEFTPTEVKFFLDGKLTHQTDATKFPHAENTVWLTSLAMLGGKPVRPKQVDDSGLPASAEFDWVRVYTKP